MMGLSGTHIFRTLILFFALVSACCLPIELYAQGEVSQTAAELPAGSNAGSESAKTAGTGDGESLLIPRFIEMDPISDEKFDLLVESVFSDRVLEYPSDLLSLENSTTPWREWKENFFNIVGDVYEVVLRFEHTGVVNKKEDKASSFYVSVEFEEERILADRMAFFTQRKELEEAFRRGNSILIKHSLPKSKSEAGGFRVPISSEKQRRLYLPGRLLSGVVVIVPQMRPLGIRGAIVCPRDFDYWKLKSGYRGMDTTGYEMVGATVRIKAIAQGSVETGFGPSYARASVQTTKNVQPGRVYLDESITQNAHVSVEYVARDPNKLPVIEGKDVITAGIRLQTILHNSLNHKTVSTGLARMTVRRIKVQRAFQLKYNQINFRVQAGDCWAILKEAVLDHVHEKVDLSESHKEYEARKAAMAEERKKASKT